MKATGEAAPAGSSPVVDAAKLGLSTLAEVLAGTEYGIAVVDGDRRYVYANPSACRMLGRPLVKVRGRRFVDSFPPGEHAAMGDRLHVRLGDPEAPFTCAMLSVDGAEHEVVCSIRGLDIAGIIHAVVIFRDVTDPRVAARTAAALAQTTAQLVGTGTVSDILERLSRHVVDGTRALACAISMLGNNHELGSAGAYVQGYGVAEAREASDRWFARGDGLVAGIIEATTAGSIVVGQVPGKVVVLPDARSVWEANPLTKAFAPNLKGLDWQAGVFIPLSWGNRVVGFFTVFLPVGLAGPSEAELAFYVALADQAAVAAINARLKSQAGQAAALVERTRLAHELHDSVSQALFSMTMHARAAQRSLAEAGVEENGPLGETIAQLGELARAATAEMRALIFELRPGALVEEGLVGALRKQGVALTAREQLAVTVDGPEERLGLSSDVEEHLYRVVSEALHNVVKHAHADCAAVSITDRTGVLTVAVSDDGVGFDPDIERSGHLGLSTMAQRALAIGADLTVTSQPGHGTTVTISLDRDQPPLGGQSPSVGAEAVRITPTRSAPPEVKDVEASPARGVKVATDERKASSVSGAGGAAPGAPGGEPGPVPLDVFDPSVVALADAAALGLSTLAEMVAGADAPIMVVDGIRRYVFVNPSAGRMLGHPPELLQGRDFLHSFPAREHAVILEHLDGGPVHLTCAMLRADGDEREVVCSIFPVDVGGSPHAAIVLSDLTGVRAAARAAVALAQTAAQLAGTENTDEILDGISRHAITSTRAVIGGITVVGDDHKLASTGAYSSPDSAVPPPSREAQSNAYGTFGDTTIEEIVSAGTGGAINIGGVPGKPVVVPDVRSIWATSPVMKGFATTLKGLDWQAAVFVPLSWENRVFGFLAVYLPTGLAGPSEAELAFYVALADQAAVAVTNARLTSQAGQAAALGERSRLARELHDSVSQVLFSMTLQARAAQRSMAKAGVDPDGPLGRSVADLGELTRGALAEMRALIFELRPAALVEEGLVAALGKQAAALSAREKVAITVEGPEQRLGLSAELEEHLYRIVSEALHNVVKHAGAARATITVTAQGAVVRAVVRDEGAGFDLANDRPGHHGLSNMAERAELMGADLTVTSAPGAGTTVVVSLTQGRPGHDKADSSGV